MTVVCLATGPSLTQSDVDYCRGKAFVLAIKDAIRMAPWADVLYACDAKWWRYYGDALTFSGQKYTLDTLAAKWATVLGRSGDEGLETTQKDCLRTGKNSGYQAINLAVHLGATKIVLLGYDMQPGVDGRDHWFGAHPRWRDAAAVSSPPYFVFLPKFNTLVQPLKDLGIEIVNATRRTALKAFPCCSLEEALA
jgi:hypothetical protein